MANHKRNRRGHDKNRPVLQGALDQQTGDSAESIVSLEAEAIFEVVDIAAFEDPTDLSIVDRTSVMQDDFFVEIEVVTEDISPQEVLESANDLDADTTSNILYYQQHELPRQTVQRTPTPPQDLDELLNSLRELFIVDREMASRADTGRCGVCYFTHPLGTLQYIEQDGLYVCPSCQQALKNQKFPMLRRQRK